MILSQRFANEPIGCQLKFYVDSDNYVRVIRENVDAVDYDTYQDEEEPEDELEKYIIYR